MPATGVPRRPAQSSWGTRKSGGGGRHPLPCTTRRPAPTSGRMSKLMLMPVARAKLLLAALARERAKPKSGDMTRMGWGRDNT